MCVCVCVCVCVFPDPVDFFVEQKANHTMLVTVKEELFNRKTDGFFFCFIFTPWNRIEIFNETKSIRLCAITTKWPYSRKHCWKRFSDFKKIKSYQHLYHCKRNRLSKNILKPSNWLVLGNKFEIYLFTKEMKWRKKGNMTDMTLGNLSYCRMFSN